MRITPRRPGAAGGIWTARKSAGMSVNPTPMNPSTVYEAAATISPDARLANAAVPQVSVSATPWIRVRSASARP